MRIMKNNKNQGFRGHVLVVKVGDGSGDESESLEAEVQKTSSQRGKDMMSKR